MAFLIAARRTAVVPKGGAFARLSLADLAAPVILACLADAGLAADEVTEVIVSNALGAGGNPARICSLEAGLPEQVAGLTVDRQCAGGLDAILLAQAMVDSGMAEVVVAGGVESFSRRPLRFRTDPEGSAPVAYDSPPFTPWPERDPGMASAADALGQRLGIGRPEQDAWAIESHAKALHSQGGLVEIVSLFGINRDQFSRTLTARTAARAKVLCGTVTSANAAVSADAAAFVVVVSDQRAKAAGRAVRLAGGITLGGRPEEPGLAPVAAILQSLNQTGLDAQNLQTCEIMEAFAVQAIACVRGADLDPKLVNPHGGALARGHPIGASGTILAVRLFHNLERGFGMAAIAAAGGIGTALILEAQ